jgi:hypothetical protein
MHYFKGLVLKELICKLGSLPLKDYNIKDSTTVGKQQFTTINILMGRSIRISQELTK